MGHYKGHLQQHSDLGNTLAPLFYLRGPQGFCTGITRPSGVGAATLGKSHRSMGHFGVKEGQKEANKLPF